MKRKIVIGIVAIIMCLALGFAAYSCGVSQGQKIPYQGTEHKHSEDSKVFYDYDQQLANKIFAAHSFDLSVAGGVVIVAGAITLVCLSRKK